MNIYCIMPWVPIKGIIKQFTMTNDNVRQHLRMIRSGDYNARLTPLRQSNTEVLDSMPYNYHLQKMLQNMTVILK